MSLTPMELSASWLNGIEDRVDKNTASAALIVPQNSAAVEKAVLSIVKATPSTNSEWRDSLGAVSIPKMGTFHLYDWSAKVSEAPGDPALDRFLKSNPATRGKCYFFAHDTRIATWPSSDYYVQGKPAAFQCSFVVAIIPKDGSTQIEAFEIQPLIVMGMVRRLSAHLTMADSLDTRNVEPSVSDRMELLRFIRGRTVPGTTEQEFGERGHTHS